MVPQEELFEELTTLINDQGAQTDKMFDALLDLTNSYRSQSLWSMGVLGVLLLVMIGFTAIVLIAVGGGITSSVDTAKRAAVRIANLQLDNTLKATSNDELGALIGALSKMQDELKVRIERDQAVAKENSRIRQALDSSAGGMMIADPDGVIIYMNLSVERVLREAESDLRALLPNFSVDKVLGSNFDVFHKDPGKQRKLISGLTSTHVANIKVGRFSFELSASPIHAEDGSRLGTTLEWRDRSAESDFRHGLRNAAQRASAGFLNARVEVRSQEVRYIELAEIFNGLIETTGKAIHEVEVVMSALAQNDLTQRSSAVLLGSFGELNDNMNRTADSLAMIIGEIQDAVREIAGSAAEISQGNQDLSARTEQAAATIEQTAAAMEELNDTVKQSAENARQATGLATKSAEVAADGGRVMSGVVGTMREIEAASKQMAEIITTIDGIAFQTNILALNAAVEAARAGEQGRGFAVVASEVRALAQRSAQAAKEIAELINSTVTKVGTGSSLVSTAGNRIEEIVTSAKKVADIIADISAATVEQARGIDEVSKAVSLMDEATQANSALVEEMAAAAESMSGQAKGLSEVTKRFKV